MKNPSLIRFTLTLRGLLIILIIGVLIFLTAARWSTIEGYFQPTATPLPPTITSTQTQTVTPTQTETLTPTVTLIPTVVKTDAEAGPLGQGLMVLSLKEGGYAHLFAYQPQSLPLTRLTNHPWDDITPALSPDGHRIAYSSRQNGYWNLYLLDLTSGQQTRLTDDPDYESSPSWSPDGKWLVFETYKDNDWGISILSLDDISQPAKLLTSDPALDESPVWSPQGRLIAFVSTRSGQSEIWEADLDKIEDRFVEVSNTPTSVKAHPAWSPDGTQLAWASTSNGISNIYIWDRMQPDVPPRLVGNGDWPVWSPDGELVLTRLQTPNQTFLTAYQASNGNVVFPPEALPASLQGMDWKPGHLSNPLPSSLAQVQRVTPTLLWQPTLTPVTVGSSGQQGIVLLKDVSAPNPYLSDEVDESFQALRQRVADEIGWDFLANLENAFIPLEGALPPGLNDDWLYTGRSFAANTIPISAGWMFAVREDYGMQTYWRLYLKTRFQDGSQGAPVDQLPWDLNARYSGDPQVYEQGGSLSASIPSGYWLDFTDLAASYGWERLPSLINWRTYFPGIRFNQFVLRNGRDWQSAMLELYPSEILITPTPILPPTGTPTQTPKWMAPRTATPTRTATITSTFRPTWTPISP
jgi:TolB protein